ncbi:MAG: hypothetical protein V1885_01350 [Candidatus Brennerbacteria bacterium]
MKFGEFFKRPERAGEDVMEGKGLFKKVINAAEVAAFLGALSLSTHESAIVQDKSEKPLSKPEIVKLHWESYRSEKKIIERLHTRRKNTTTTRIFTSNASDIKSEDVPVKSWANRSGEVEVVVGFDEYGTKPRFIFVNVDGGENAFVDNDMDGFVDRVIANKDGDKTENFPLAFGSMERLQELAELTPDEKNQNIKVYELERRPDGTIGVKGVDFMKKEFVDVNSSNLELKEKIEKVNDVSQGNMTEALRKVESYIEGED